MKRLFGAITLHIRGEQVAAVLAAAYAQHITLYRVVVFSDSHAYVLVHWRQWRALVQLVKRYRCRVLFHERRGPFFQLKRLYMPLSLALSACAAICLLIYVFNCLWSIRIEGGTTDVRQAIRKQLVAMNVVEGRLFWRMPSLDDVEQRLAHRFPTVNWLMVTRQGQRISVKVVMVKQFLPVKPSAPSHLIASKAAVIQSWFVAQGRVLVKRHQYVKRGTRLVSGQLAPQRTVAAQGRVMGEVWYEAAVTLPLIRRTTVIRAQSPLAHSLVWNGRQVPLTWWRSRVVSGTREQRDTALYFGTIRLPIQWRQSYSVQTEERREHPSRRTLTARALSLAVKQIQRQANGPIKVIQQKVLKETIVNGKVKVVVFMRVMENIATKQRFEETSG